MVGDFSLPLLVHFSLPVTGCFQSLNQVAGINKKINKQSFYGLMQEELSSKTDYYRRMFGLDE